MLPPKPISRKDKASLWQYMKAFKQDILSAQPERLYRAWMAEFKTPFFRSYLVNQPELIQLILKERPDDFPKSDRVGEGLRPLLGESVFLTNGEDWKRQRRIIDPAFEGGRLKETYPAMYNAAQAMVDRLSCGVHEVEEMASFAAADVIFRTLFSIPIEDEIASAVFHEFRKYQREQPILNVAAFVPLPKWMPRFHSRQTKSAACTIRRLIKDLTQMRMEKIRAGTAQLDLATKIMTTEDSQTGQRFDTAEMVDQVAIFFLAGHETSASALAWSLYLMALYPDRQDRLAEEARILNEDFSSISRLRLTRAVFREALRLYPPVPMMVRETVKPETFRERVLKKGSTIVISPWHLHRQNRLWDNPDEFDPDRWESENGKTCQREAFIPFSAGARV
ncbi:MAG: cytochrome P450, partial [Rhodobacteraceae bacterium]|nr:cytochrome P450 [Paracoccaceae bacterium]